ncbi:MAG: glycosyltransferase [Prochloraceae cyanobacterium]
MTNKQRLGKYLNWLALLAIWVTALIGLYLLRNHTTHLALSGWENLIVLGIIGIWRWSWLMLHVIRSIFYRIWVFPRWRRQANRISLDQLPPLAIVIPTYKEKSWITERVFRAIASEAQTLHYALTLAVVSTPEENQAIARIIKSVDPQLHSINFLPLIDPGTGKRGALAKGLEALSRLNLPEGSVVALMDGDSELSPGSLRRSLPFFRLFPKMGGLTTNEMPEVHGSDFFSEWLHLRFSQRNQYMCSYALSHKVLCLTGRCSFFRAEAALAPSFSSLLASDYLNDWLWGQFRFFSGDDKSTWYWLLRQGYEMLYLPDVMVHTIETISGSLSQRCYQNMRRWSGNMLRNGTRALALGPRKVGFFTWLCILDQRVSIWTTLISPGIFLIASLQGNWLSASILCCWLLVSRPIYLTVVFWGRKSRLKLIHLPIMLIAQWSTSLVKIWTQMHLAQQKWTNRHGNKGRSADGWGWRRWLKSGSSRFLLFSQCFSFVVFLFWQYGSLSVTNDVAGWWWTRQMTPQSVPTQIIAAIDYGIYPSDRQDDSAALQALIDSLPATGIVQIDLPLGEIDLFQSLEINRSHTFIKGQGAQGTILLAHKPALLAEAIVAVRPPSNAAKRRVENVQLSDFTIKSAPSAQVKDSINILLENVVQAALKNLHLSASGRNALSLSKTENVTLEYVVVEGTFQQEEIVLKNTVNTQIH